MSNYPQRDKFFAHQLTRLLFKSCAAQSIGQDAVLLIIHIAHTEDAARYQGPVRFWNSQLNETLGFRSPKSLNNARAKAVEAGWLVYERKNDRADGKYFTTIPRHVMEFDDSPIESIPEPVPQPVPSTESVPSTEQKREREAEQEGYALRNGKVTGNDPPPNPYPNPNPKEREQSLPPTLEQVRAEVKAKGYTAIDPDQWWSYWDSIHWTEKAGRIIKWQSRLMSDNLTPKPAWKLASEKAAKESEKQTSFYKRG